jgi:hypothetical protein
MSSRWVSFIFLPFLFFSAFASPVRDQSIQSRVIDSSSIPSDCAGILDQIQGNAEWKEQLINPLLRTEQDISERHKEYAVVDDCISQSSQPISDEWLTIQKLIRYFQTFAGVDQAIDNGSTLVQVDLAKSADPAVIKMRDEAGISPPQGIIFVRFYASRAAMPDFIQKVFENEEIAGVTFLTRYIAVLAEKQQTWIQNALQNQILPETISHELIHAYINAVLGIAGMNMPKWYHEGLATYFSESGEGHTIVTPDLTISTTLPEEYQQYLNNFKFLEAKLGREGLLARIKQSIEQEDPALLYKDLGIANEQELIQRAGAWKQQRIIIQASLFTVIVLSISLILWQRMPDVRCPNCGHTGRKKDFIDGVCPECHYPIGKIED